MKARDDSNRQTGHTGDDPPVHGRAVVYLRPYNFGTDIVIEHHAGLSISQQGRACYQVAGRLGLEVVDEIVDHGGPEWNRRGIRELVESVDAHQVDTVICFSRTRLFERLDEILDFTDCLKMSGVRIVLSGATNACLEHPDA